MPMGIVISLFYLLLGFGSSAEAIGRQSTELPVGLRLTSDYSFHDFVEGVNVDSRLIEEEKTPELHIQSLRGAQITRLDATHLRFELNAPIAFTMVDVNGRGDNVERVLRSFVVRTRVYLADQLMALYQGRYMVLDDSTNQHIEELLAEFEARGAGHMLSAFARGRIRPRIHTLDSIEFMVNADRLGSPEGADVVHFTLRTWDISEIQPAPGVGAPGAARPQRIDFNDIVRLIKPEENQLVENYVQMLQEVESARETLRSRGWLQAVYNPELSRQDTRAALNDPDVVPFPGSPQCQRVFETSSP